MRRNVSRDFGNQLQNPGGPLLTDHLRDLDMELELLKRKRELIQQEQNMLNRYTTKRQFDYQQPPNTYDRQESSHQFNPPNYSNRYDGPSGSSHSIRSQGSKRQTPNQYWQANPTQKRFPPAQKINPWQSSNSPKPEFSGNNRQPRSGNYVQQIRPLMGVSIGQKFQKTFPTQRRDFKPTKVTKPKYKSQQGPHKPPAKKIETKKLVSQMINSEKKTESDQILRADKTPTVQMKGRLELALGNIMKEIKNDHCSDPAELECFQAPFIQRLIKHTIRTRIRNVMIDQVVGNVNDVVANYRKKFPKETDIELVQVAKDAQILSTQNIGVAQLIESDDPQEFYKKNMIKVLTTKVEDMFLNLEQLYLNKKKDIDELAKKMPEPKLDSNVEENKQNDSDENTNSDKEKISLENIVGDKGDTNVVSEKLSKVNQYIQFMDEVVEQRLPKILPKFKDLLLSILLSDKEFLSTKTMIMSQLRKKLVKSLEKDVFEEAPPKTTPRKKAKSSTSKTSATTVQSPSAGPSSSLRSEDSAKKVSPPEANSEEKAATVASTPEANSENKATTVVSAPEANSEKKATTVLSAPEANSEETATTVDSAVQETTEDSAAKATTDDSTTKTVTDSAATEATDGDVQKTKAPASDVEPPATPNKASIISTPAATPKTPASEIYFVKLISRPTMPARAVIYDFLSKYKPASIKKHKSINNLLVIGFTNQEDYDRILTVNETVVGNTTIIIKASEQVNKTPQTQDKVTRNGSKSVDQSLLDDSSVNDLDNQISDLLTSIRKADENDKPLSDDKKNTSDTANKSLIDENTNKAELETKIDSDDKIGNEKTSDKNSDSEKVSDDIKTIAGTEKTITRNVEDSTTKEGQDTTADLKPDEAKNKTELETITESNDNEADSEKLENDKVKDLKETGRNTPTRSSSRLANVTPSTIRTRRASRLAQN